MLAYKFRAASAADHIFDILLNRRLYCADWTKLNDPVEGLFAFSCTKETERVHRAFADATRDEKQKLRVCSLAGTFDCHLLWAHYADGFNGVAIEVELPDDDDDIRRVDYRGVFALLDPSKHRDPTNAAREILFSKYDEWKYEREIRILNRGGFYELSVPVRRVICGHRMNGALFDAIQLVCEHQAIEICRIGIGDEGLDADWVGPSRFSKPPHMSARK